MGLNKIAFDRLPLEQLKRYSAGTAFISSLEPKNINFSGVF